MATTKQMFAEIITKLDKLLARGATPTGMGGTVSNPTPPPDPFVGPNSVIQPGIVPNTGERYFPSGMRPDGGQWTKELWEEFLRRNPDWEPVCGDV